MAKKTWHAFIDNIDLESLSVLLLLLFLKYKCAVQLKVHEKLGNLFLLICKKRANISIGHNSKKDKTIVEYIGMYKINV